MQKIRDFKNTKKKQLFVNNEEEYEIKIWEGHTRII